MLLLRWTDRSGQEEGAHRGRTPGFAQQVRFPTLFCTVFCRVKKFSFSFLPRWFCYVCSRPFFTKTDLYRHLQKQHSGGEALTRLEEHPDRNSNVSKGENDGVNNGESDGIAKLESEGGVNDVAKTSVSDTTNADEIADDGSKDGSKVGGGSNGTYLCVERGCGDPVRDHGDLASHCLHAHSQWRCPLCLRDLGSSEAVARLKEAVEEERRGGGAKEARRKAWEALKCKMAVHLNTGGHPIREDKISFCGKCQMVRITFSKKTAYPFLPFLTTVEAVNTAVVLPAATKDLGHLHFSCSPGLLVRGGPPAPQAGERGGSPGQLRPPSPRHQSRRRRQGQVALHGGKEQRRRLRDARVPHVRRGVPIHLHRGAPGEVQRQAQGQEEIRHRQNPNFPVSIEIPKVLYLAVGNMPFSSPC